MIVHDVVNQQKLDQVEAYLVRVRRELRLPGLAVAIVQGGQTIYAQGFGAAHADQAVTPHTPFILGSLSKSFTALAVMQLVEQGKLALDDPIQNVLPWFTIVDPAASAQMTDGSQLNSTIGGY